MNNFKPVLLILLVSACAKLPPAVKDQYALSRKSGVVGIEKPFQLLEERCTSGGGKYLSDSGVCDCGSGKALTLQVAQDIYVCSEAENQKQTGADLVGIPNASNHVNHFIQLKNGKLSPKDVRTLAKLFYAQSPIDGTVNYSISAWIANSQSGEGFSEGKGLRIAKTADAQMKSVVLEMWRALQAEPIPGRTISQGDAGCIESCDDLNFAYSNEVGEVVRLRRFRAGGIAAHFAVARDIKEMPASSVVLMLTPKGALYAVAKIENVKQGSFEFEQRISFYDSELNAITDRPLVQRTQSEDEFEKVKAYAQASQEDHGVAVCVGGASSAFSDRYGSKVVRGPSQSILGWVSDQYAGLEIIDPITGVLSGSGLEEVYERNLNDRFLMETLNEDSDVELKFALIPQYACNGSDSWIKNLEDHSSIRVISGSYVEHFTPAACAHAPVVSNIYQTSDTFLWVFSAGDDHEDLDTGAPSACPQTLMGAQNLIKVAAADGGDLENRSNYGYLSIDLAAPGEKDKVMGSSFAAGRVSRVAAKIHQAYSALTPDQIRKMLMLSVDFNPDQILRVRSGGILNETRAMEMASWLDMKKPTSDLEWVNGFYCEKKKSTDCESVEARLKHWKKTGMI